MKIRKLSIKNFRNIKSLAMENIPDLVVLAGPNGSGKTSIFDAIRIFKAIIGPYNPSELGTIRSTELKNQLKTVVNLKADSAEITIGVQLSESEIKFLSSTFNNDELLAQNQGLLSASIQISKTGSYNILDQSPPLSELLKHYDPTGEVGIIEYIPSHREIPRTEVGAITLSPESLDQEKLERTGAAGQKFSRLKYYLVMMVIYDKMEISDKALEFFPQIQDFFKEFFFPKKFEIVHVDRGLRWHFPIKTPDGTHDIDFLSSGEKEILMTYANILRLKLTNSIILFDEPELHLNASLERKVINNLRKIVNAGNQIWVGTHSFEIIGTVPLENLYQLYRDISPNKQNQIELCSTKRDRINALGSLGASIGIQLISNRIVFVEGPSDREFLQNLYEEYGDKVTFKETHGVKSLMHISKAAIDLLDQVSEYDSFFMIRDRDFLTKEEIEEIRDKYKGKIFVWNRRKIENYLIEPQIILKVLKMLGINSFKC